MLGIVDGGVHDLEVGHGRVRLAAHERAAGAIVGNRRGGAEQVAGLEGGGEGAEGAEPDDARDARLHELFDHERGRGAADAVRLDTHALAVERADVTDHAARIADQVRFLEHLGGE